MGEFGIRRSQQPQGQEQELIKPQTAEEHELTGKEVLEWLNEKMRIKKMGQFGIKHSQQPPCGSPKDIRK
ncbi:MAG: hypothetical protein MGU50_24450 [Trichodesmium sp. MAG_R02]|jgi:hypothetical protein|nr:hypothetical protein [Trichodesmium sp. MAG_R02]